MTFGAALLYFLTESVKGLWRNWKVSVVAVAAIAASLALAAAFWLVCSNAAGLLAEWRADSRVSVYFKQDAAEAEVRALAVEVEALPAVESVAVVDPGSAAGRLQATFPGFAGVFSAEGGQLPWSLEIRARAGAGDLADQLPRSEKILLVDDDRDWLQQLEALLVVLRSSALVLGGLICLTTILTIASVVRLTALLHNDEIAVLRLVGATEFYIRGPFYFAGITQGFAGGLLGVAGLVALRWAALDAVAAEAPLLGLLLEKSLSAGQYVGVVALASLSGLLGSITSLRREEALTFDTDTPNWEE
jgi:cell division transport system permease protein